MSELYTTDGGAETDADADSLPVGFGDDRAEPVEPGEPEDPLDLVGPPTEFDEPGKPEGEREPLEPSAREEGPEGGFLGQARDAVSWWKEPTEEAVDLHATVDRPDFNEVTPAGDYRYGTPLDGPDGKRIPLFDGPPAREQTKQGDLGDCGIISTMGAVAGHRPEAISDCVRENGDGTYEVTLHQTKRSHYGDWSRFEPTGAVTVLTITPDLPVASDSPDRPAYARSSANDVAWVPILEKAIAGVDATWDEGRTKPVEGYIRLDRGTFPNHRAELLTQLTGQPAYTDDFPTQYDMQGRSPDRQLTETLREKLTDGCPVLVGTVNPETDDRILPKGLLDGHAYEVTEVDERGLIHLRNPHNLAHPEPLTVTEFRESIKNRYTTMG
ncbi:C2 family cysteine protease [Streptomyces sp. NPDC059757]|uniref:C2 family cysteine protease n=1 Tax=Streptomyces sp. NPDC059757 TaxID=3346935 RepID=UPI00364F55B1